MQLVTGGESAGVYADTTWLQLLFQKCSRWLAVESPFGASEMAVSVKLEGQPRS